jgi:hypothetical protein
MKPPKVKPHLVETPHVLVETGPCEAICEAKIKRSRFIPLAETDWTPGEKDSPVRSREICTDCQKVLETRTESVGAISRYLVLEHEVEADKA